MLAFALSFAMILESLPHLYFKFIRRVRHTSLLHAILPYNQYNHTISI